MAHLRWSPVARCWLCAGLFSLWSGGARGEESPDKKGLSEPVQNVLDSVAEAHRPNRDLMDGSLSLWRSRLGSGTSWLPSSSPMYGLMSETKRVGFMLRGSIFLGYSDFERPRGARGFFSSNTLLAVLFRERGPHEWMPRVALSWEAFTNRGSSPHILQTDQDLSRAPLYDRQTPQDLISELSLTYTYAVRDRSALQIYLALAGQAALGPSAYNYRVSSFSDPLPPITQAVLESFPSYFVLTVGYFWRMAKLEASWFNAQRSALHHYDLDWNVPRSLAARVTVNPNPDWSAQISYAYLNGFRAAWIAQRSQRLNLSVTYNRRFGDEANWASTLAAGGRKDHGSRAAPAAFLESTWNIEGHHTVFGRIEYARVAAASYGLPATGRTDVGNLVLGYAYYFRPLVSLAPGVGVRGSLAALDRRLEEAYGARSALGVIAYVQLRPAALVMKAPSDEPGADAPPPR